MIHATQIAVPASAATFLVTIPPGEVTTVITNASTVATIYFGTGGTAVTASTGHPVPPTMTITLPAMDTSRGGVLYGIASAGTVPTGVTLVTNG